MTIYDTHLQAKVAVWNKTHAEANRIRPILIEFFRPFVGKKICISGGFIKKIRETLPKVGEGFRLWADTDYSLRFELSGTENYKARDYSDEHNYCHPTHAKVDMYVGDFNRAGIGQYGCDLEKLSAPDDWKPRRTDYTVEEVAQLRKTAEAAEDASRAAQSALYPFEKYDR